MLKKDVIAHYGTQRSVALALGISDAAVSQWKAVIPEKDAYRLQVLTDGQLKCDSKTYRKVA
jgi:predicted transcriptional regulator